MSTTARWAEPAACLNAMLGVIRAHRPLKWGVLRSVEVPFLVTNLDEKAIAGLSKSAGRVRRGDDRASGRRHRRLPQRSGLL